MLSIFEAIIVNFTKKHLTSFSIIIFFNEHKILALTKDWLNIIKLQYFIIIIISKFYKFINIIDYIDIKDIL